MFNLSSQSPYRGCQNNLIGADNSRIEVHVAWRPFCLDNLDTTANAIVCVLDWLYYFKYSSMIT